MRVHWHLSLMATAVMALTACGTMPGAPGALRPVSGPVAQASPLSSEEAAIVTELVAVAQAAIAHADAAYEALKLNTAHGRKITPDKEPMLLLGLRPVVERFEADSETILARLRAADTRKLHYLARELTRRGPQPLDPDMPAAAVEPSASDLLYRVAQYRVRFGFLLEYANRRGLLPKAPTWKVPK